ncbi:MAG: HlyD family efflux transporter periplasmic adaptor subunit [Cyanobacteriota bacterium]|nr:HlyD family efflux transporter periplasmic adaptor subunit [Cyanobacteriota bacterium]
MGLLRGQPRIPILIGTGLALATLVGLGVNLRRSSPSASVPPAQPQAPVRQEAVAALGTLEPQGDVRRLAAPISGIGGSPVIAALLVQEGEAVVKGQLLARFDTRQGLLADQAKSRTRIANLKRRLLLQTRDIARYRSLSQTGAYPVAELDLRETRLLELQSLLADAQAEQARVQADLALTELRAPLAGTVLRVHSRTGERPGDEGVLELGASNRMEALVEVYESDIGRVRIGQTVALTSENGGFSGSLNGRVVRISPQVRQRQVLSTDPTGDADARIVEVRVALDPMDIQRVRDLSGLKVIARISP